MRLKLGDGIGGVHDVCGEIHEYRHLIDQHEVLDYLKSVIDVEEIDCQAFEHQGLQQLQAFTTRKKWTEHHELDFNPFSPERRNRHNASTANNLRRSRHERDEGEVMDSTAPLTMTIQVRSGPGAEEQNEATEETVESTTVTEKKEDWPPQWEQFPEDYVRLLQARKKITGHPETVCTPLEFVIRKVPKVCSMFILPETEPNNQFFDMTHPANQV